MTIEQAIRELKPEIQQNAKRLDALRAQEAARKKLVASLTACAKYNSEFVINAEKAMYEAVRKEREVLEARQRGLVERLHDLNRMDAANKKTAADERKRIATARSIGRRIRERDMKRYERRCAEEAFEHAEAVNDINERCDT